MTRLYSLFFILFFCLPICSFANIDLELSGQPSELSGINQNGSVEFTLTNKGTSTATNIFVHINRQGLNITSFPTATIGSVNFHWTPNAIWSIQHLEAGQTTTVSIPVFTLGEDYTLYAQVASFNGTDIDSAPNNGTLFSPNEDDEASSPIAEETTLPSDCSTVIEGAEILCSRYENGITELSVLSNGDLVNYSIDSESQILTTDNQGHYAVDSTFIQDNNKLIHQLSDGSIAYELDLPDALLDYLPLRNPSVPFDDIQYYPQGNIKATPLSTGEFLFALSTQEYSPILFGDNFSGYSIKTKVFLAKTDSNLNIITTKEITNTRDAGAYSSSGVVYLSPTDDGQAKIVYHFPFGIYGQHYFYSVLDAELNETIISNPTSKLVNQITETPCGDLKISDNGANPQGSTRSITWYDSNDNILHELSDIIYTPQYTNIRERRYNFNNNEIEATATNTTSTDYPEEFTLSTNNQVAVTTDFFKYIYGSIAGDQVFLYENGGNNTINIINMNCRTASGNPTTVQGTDIALDLEILGGDVPLYANFTTILSATNNGTEAATNVKIAFDVDAQVNTNRRFGFIGASNASYDHWNGVWNIPNIEPGETANVSVTLFYMGAFNETGETTIDANLMSLNEVDSNEANNYAATTIYTSTIRDAQASDLTKNVIDVFPNPATDYIRLSIDNADKLGENKLKIANANGNIILSKIIHLSEGENEITLDIQHLPASIYSVFLENQKGKTIATRFIKTRL